MIDVRRLTKRYGRAVAVDDLSMTIRPGLVTGFLGPNGAGKTTTMRIALGLAAPSAGDVLLDGRSYAQLARPLFVVGALLDATAIDTARTAVDHLRWIARSHRIGEARVRSLLEQVGLAGVARRPIATFSLGMKQRLGLAAALLGDPGILVLDEPANGLDPDGVRWLRELLRSLAAEGRTVFVSSHLVSEMAITADRLVIIGRGRLIADATVTELAQRFDRSVVARTASAPALASAIALAGGTVEIEPDGRLLVRGIDATAVGQIASRLGLALQELGVCRPSLEEAYMALTQASAEHGSPGGLPR